MWPTPADADGRVGELHLRGDRRSVQEVPADEGVQHRHEHRDIVHPPDPVKAPKTPGAGSTIRAPTPM